MSDVSVNTPGSSTSGAPAVIDASTSSVQIGDGSRTAQVTAGSELRVTDQVLNAKIPSVGQKSSSNSIPVVMASDYTPPAQSILISHTDDSIRLGDGTTLVNVTAANALKTDSSHTTQPISGSVSISNLPVTQPVSGSVSISNFPSSQAVTVSSSALPSGAATSALQTTSNSSLSSIDGKIPALGQALAAASTPVVLTAAQISTLTPLSSVSVSNFPASQAVTGTFFQATQPVSIASMPSTPVTGTFFQATQPVSGTVTANAGTGTFTVSGTVTANAGTGTMAVSAASLPLPTNAATSALQTTGNTSLGSIDTKLNSLSAAPGSDTGQPAIAVRVISQLGAAGGSGGGSSIADKATFTEGTTSLTVSGGVYNETISADPTEDQAAAARITAKRALHVNLRNASGVEVAPLTDTQLRASPVPVSGTVTTGGLTDTQLRASAVPVSLTSTTVTNTVAVSGPLTDTQLRATAVPVSGPLTDTQIRATALPVSGTVSVTGVATETTLAALNTKVTAVNTGAVVVSSSALPTGAATEATLSALNTKVTAVNTGAVTISTALPTGTNSIGTVVAPTITKSTQGATGFTTQDLKDAGRNNTNFYMNVPIITTATDAVQLLTGYKSGAAVAATATPAVVTAAKTFRITGITITYVSIATAGSVKFTLRANPAGVAVLASPAVCAWVVGTTAAVAGVSQVQSIPIPDGLEFAAGTGIAVSMVGLSATQAAAAVGYGQIAITGYEY